MHEHGDSATVSRRSIAFWAAAGRAVVDDPEDALRGGVGLGAHDLSDERVERLVADLPLAAPERPSRWPGDLPGPQVGRLPASTVFVLDPPRAGMRHLGVDEQVTWG